MSRRDARQKNCDSAAAAKAGSVDDATATLLAMKAARAAQLERQEALAAERQEIAGAALIDRDVDAAKRLETLTTETTRITADLENLDAALDRRTRPSGKGRSARRDRARASERTHGVAADGRARASRRRCAALP